MPRKAKEPVPIRLGHCGIGNPPELHLQCRGEWNDHPCACPHHGDQHYFDEPANHCPTCTCKEPA